MRTWIEAGEQHALEALAPVGRDAERAGAREARFGEPVREPAREQGAAVAAAHPRQVLDLVGLVGQVDQYAARLVGRAAREPACEAGLLARQEGGKELEVVAMPDACKEAARGHGEEQGFAAHGQTGRRVMSS